MKKSINILLFVFAVCAFLPNMVFAQTTSDKGRIEVLSWSWGETQISLVSRDGKTVIKTTTDAKGNFTFQTIPVGNYTVKFSKRNGTVPKTGVLFFNGIKENVCC
ncbi:MAG: carboxypeptidase-like regulatory domain-containing protein, partial [Ignavibacteria bacterium]|nr:carboxypeptidase-like regulatory domain-containing protein [Ignavibacteria bacterium]